MRSDVERDRQIRFFQQHSLWGTSFAHGVRLTPASRCHSLLEKKHQTLARELSV
jgi:hypothetical protein